MDGFLLYLTHGWTTALRCINILWALVRVIDHKNVNETYEQ